MFDNQLSVAIIDMRDISIINTVPLPNNPRMCQRNFKV